MLEESIVEVKEIFKVSKLSRYLLINKYIFILVILYLKYVSFLSFFFKWLIMLLVGGYGLVCLWGISINIVRIF